MEGTFNIKGIVDSFIYHAGEPYGNLKLLDVVEAKAKNVFSRPKRTTLELSTELHVHNQVMHATSGDEINIKGYLLFKGDMPEFIVTSVFVKVDDSWGRYPIKNVLDIDEQRKDAKAMAILMGEDDE